MLKVLVPVFLETTTPSVLSLSAQHLVIKTPPTPKQPHRTKKGKFPYGLVMFPDEKWDKVGNQSKRKRGGGGEEDGWAGVRKWTPQLCTHRLLGVGGICFPC